MTDFRTDNPIWQGKQYSRFRDRTAPEPEPIKVTLADGSVKVVPHDYFSKSLKADEDE